MMKILVTLVLAMVVLTTGCAPSKSETSAVDSSGNCKQETIDSFNAIVESVRSYGLTGEKKHLVSASAKCDEFNSLMGAQSCVAVDTTTAQKTTVTQSDADKMCQLVKKTLTPAPTPPAEEVTETPPQDENSKPLPKSESGKRKKPKKKLAMMNMDPSSPN
jgi:hypothetical protein